MTNMHKNILDIGHRSSFFSVL